MQREMDMPSDIEGEDVIMAGQASYQDGMVTRANWKPGYLYLTKERLIFLQGANKLFAISLNSHVSVLFLLAQYYTNKVYNGIPFSLASGDNIVTIVVLLVGYHILRIKFEKSRLKDRVTRLRANLTIRSSSRF